MVLGIAVCHGYGGNNSCGGNYFIHVVRVVATMKSPRHGDVMLLPASFKILTLAPAIRGASHDYRATP